MNIQSTDAVISGKRVFCDYPESKNSEKFTKLIGASVSFRKELEIPPKEKKSFASFPTRFSEYLFWLLFGREFYSQRFGYRSDCAYR